MRTLLTTSALLLAISAALPADAADPAQRSTRLGGQRGVATVRAQPARGTTPLTPPQRVELFKALIPGVLDAAALMEPVRLSPRAPSHLDRVFVETAGSTAARTGLAGTPECWSLGGDSKDQGQLSVFVKRGAFAKPILVDCLVRRTSSPQGYPEKVGITHGTQEQTAKLTADYQHVSIVIEPDPQADGQVSFKKLEFSPTHKVEIAYCDVTMLK